MLERLQPGDEIAIYPVELSWVGSVQVRGEVRRAIGVVDEEAERVVLALDDDAARQLIKLLRKELDKGDAA